MSGCKKGEGCEDGTKRNHLKIEQENFQLMIEPKKVTISLISCPELPVLQCHTTALNSASLIKET